ncbi:hypothetical protein WJU99_002231 [Salmonella enterica]|nr:hypothetical protein [Salmonella enterica]EEP9538271.1 hypothetical protein [Salmonella enterica]ELK1698049.1 hypothetical protein [Salmonella enterica]
MSKQEIKSHPVIRKNNTISATLDDAAVNQHGDICMHGFDVTPNSRGHFTEC